MYAGVPMSRSGLGSCRRLSGGDGDPEVRQQRAPRLVVQEDVLGLDVAMDDAARVRVCERRRDVRQDRLGALRREQPILAHRPVEPTPRDVLHHERNAMLAVRAQLFHRVDGDDVRMLQLGDRARFAELPLDRGGDPPRPYE